MKLIPKANWSPRFGAAYQLNPKAVGRIGGGILMGDFEPGGGAANLLNPPFIVNTNSSPVPTCSQGLYCESQYAYNNTLEGGLGAFMGPGGIANNAAFPGVSMQDSVMHMPYPINYNASVQQVLTPTTTLTVSYVGSLGRHLVTGRNNPDMPLAIQQFNGLTPAPHLSGQFWMSWTGASSYNALQVNVQKRYSSGLAFFGSYTWGHAFDNTVDMLGGDYGSYKQSALIPIRYEWGQSGYDIRNRAVINIDYDLPFGEGRRWVDHGGILNEIFGGWKTDMEWWGQTGQPFTVGISRTPGWQNANGDLANSAVKIANPYDTGLPAPPQSFNPITASGMTNGTPSNVSANVCAAKTRTRTRWFNPCAFADPLGVINTSNAAAVNALAPYATGYFSYQSPAIGADSALANGIYSNLKQPAPYVTGYANVAPFFGTPKNDVSGPGNWRLNASIFKDFKVWREGAYLELRADAFNVLNHPSWGQPGGTSTNIGTNIVAITTPIVQPEQHHQRAFSPVVRKVRVLVSSSQNSIIDARYFQLSGKYVF